MSCLRYVFLMLAVHCIGLAGQCNPATHAANDTKTLKAWLMEKYDRWSVPNATILVGTSLRLIHIYGIDTEMDSYWMELQILADWVDCNLAYDAELNPSIPYLAWSWRDSEIWQPDFLPVNLRDDYVYPIGGVQVMSLPPGIVYMKLRFTARYACTMDLRKIPYDIQWCNWTAHPLWGSAFVGLRPGNIRATGTSDKYGYFPLEIYPLTNKEWLFSNFSTSKTLMPFDGVASYWGATLTFAITRKAYWYTVNLLIPSLVMWLLSYCSVYVNPSAVPGRVTMLVLPILILITLSTRAFNLLPIISDPTWLTDYLFAITMLCCVHLIEFVVVHVSIRATRRRLLTRQLHSQRQLWPTKSRVPNEEENVGCWLFCKRLWRGVKSAAEATKEWNRWEMELEPRPPDRLEDLHHTTPAGSLLSLNQQAEEAAQEDAGRRAHVRIAPIAGAGSGRREAPEEEDEDETKDDDEEDEGKPRARAHGRHVRIDPLFAPDSPGGNGYGSPEPAESVLATEEEEGRHLMGGSRPGTARWSQRPREKKEKGWEAFIDRLLRIGCILDIPARVVFPLILLGITVAYYIFRR